MNLEHNFEALRHDIPSYVGAAIAGTKNPKKLALIYKGVDLLTRAAEGDEPLTVAIKAFAHAVEDLARRANMRDVAERLAAQHRYADATAAVSQLLSERAL